MRRLLLVTSVAAVSLLPAAAIPPALAQTSVAEMLEQARARARDIEELKRVLNGPDQNMRLAAFDVMVTSGDDAMRQVAIDAGLASADALLQGMAFKEAILGLNRILMSLEVDKGQPEEVQARAQAILQKDGSSYEVPIVEGDRKTGVFKTRGSDTGQVSGTTVTFKNGYDSGQLALVDETTIRGPIRIYQRGNGGFIATAKIR
ncbi:hypothetical protein [Thiococcus pfennigii]|uniref:hypothetical protein n=1 Tax=Thiococcus pfennigii TaxID=1057 RepID=UPI001903CEA7|nr:hypothetical protein [Thiococcus pfennigii]